MPSGKYTDGYTKSAQRQKFVRHRDIKMKDSELKKEAKIQKLMSEGICRRCREKVQWRFKYDKYKPLKAPATCQQCRQKTITKAYRTLCDTCAAQRNVCPSCCLDPIQNEKLDEDERKLQQNTVFKLPATTNSASESHEMEEARNEEETEMMEEEEEDADEEEEGDRETAPNESVIEEEHKRLEDSLMGGELVMDLKWDEKKFTNIAANKYSKVRTTGMEER